MLKVRLLDYDDLPEEVQPLFEDGWGKEYAGYLVVYHKDKVIAVFWDAMEPEDACFYRDLNWIQGIILQAYQHGKEDGKEKK